ncbi:MAG TPA: hypothetical protein VL443_19085 [Cyclobacteriaceae bacterium]|jgi:hypothetical protein|nr:hypothetical protein [Cyclobacteriaceae bacterium]
MNSCEFLNIVISSIVSSIVVYAIDKISKKCIPKIDLSRLGFKIKIDIVVVEFYLLKFLPIFEVVVIAYSWVLTILTVIVCAIEFNFVFFIYITLLTSFFLCLAFIVLKQRYIAEVVLAILIRK